MIELSTDRTTCVLSSQLTQVWIMDNPKTFRLKLISDRSVASKRDGIHESINMCYLCSALHWGSLILCSKLFISSSSSSYNRELWEKLIRNLGDALSKLLPPLCLGPRNTPTSHLALCSVEKVEKVLESHPVDVGSENMTSTTTSEGNQK